MQRLADQLVVLGVWINPKPHDPIRGLDANGTAVGAVQTRSDRLFWSEVTDISGPVSAARSTDPRGPESKQVASDSSARTPAMRGDSKLRGGT